MGHFLHEAAEASHSPGLYTLATFVGSFFAADVEKKSKLSIYFFYTISQLKIANHNCVLPPIQHITLIVT